MLFLSPTTLLVSLSSPVAVTAISTPILMEISSQILRLVMLLSLCWFAGLRQGGATGPCKLASRYGKKCTKTHLFITARPLHLDGHIGESKAQRTLCQLVCCPLSRGRQRLACVPEPHLRTITAAREELPSVTCASLENVGATLNRHVACSRTDNMILCMSLIPYCSLPTVAWERKHSVTFVILLFANAYPNI